jgi:hypothetical protein
VWTSPFCDLPSPRKSLCGIRPSLVNDLKVPFLSLCPFSARSRVWLLHLASGTNLQSVALFRTSFNLHPESAENRLPQQYARRPSDYNSLVARFAESILRYADILTVPCPSSSPRFCRVQPNFEWKPSKYVRPQGKYCGSHIPTR